MTKIKKLTKEKISEIIRSGDAQLCDRRQMQEARKNSRSNTPMQKITIAVDSDKYQEKLEDLQKYLMYYIDGWAKCQRRLQILII